VEGLAAFALARHENLVALDALTDAQRSRGGTQEGAGRVTLRDIPMRMREHDASHRKEIEELVLALPSL
jgi:rhodanese-related sulfurtransferase